MKMILNKPHADVPQILIANTNSIQNQGRITYTLIHTVPKEEKKNMCRQFFFLLLLEGSVTVVSSRNSWVCQTTEECKGTCPAALTAADHTYR